MRPNPIYEVCDARVVRELIIANPWATLVSNGDDGIVASHYPVLLDDCTEDLAIVTHVGRPDDQLHRFGRSEMLLIVSGPDGYISPSWCDKQALVPTWNFSVAHCYGVPEVLEAEENLRVLTRLVDHFEQHVDAPSSLDPEVGARLAGATVGIRLAITRFECKVKMSQDKDPRSQKQVLDALRGSGPYRNPTLAEEMQRVLAADRR
jgi:transcriptional regulator